MTAATSSPTRGKVYIVVAGTLSYGSVLAYLVTDTGATLCRHVAASVDELRTDPVGHAGPKALGILAELYPEGYDVEVIDGWAEAPDWLRQKNAEWATSQGGDDV